MNKKKIYSKQWEESSKFIYCNDDYYWMCNQIEPYHTILEIGCGTGESTLALVEQGHKVIAVEKNQYCLEKAKSLIINKGYTYEIIGEAKKDSNVIFILGDICNDEFSSKLSTIIFDIIVCWNIGTYWSEDMFDYYGEKLLNYGLTWQQIKENPESSYSEFIQWKCCNIAKEINLPVHFIDRGLMIITEKNDTYFISLKNEFGYSEIKYNNRKSQSKSLGGVSLRVGQQVCLEKSIDIVFTSVLLIN